MKKVKAVSMIKFIGEEIFVIDCKSIKELAEYFAISPSRMGRLIKNKRSFRGFILKEVIKCKKNT